MKKHNKTTDRLEPGQRTSWFVEQCRANNLKVTPQRIAIYEALSNTDEHPSAEVLYRQIRKAYPRISLDTVNRTLLTLAEIGVASVVEGSGDAKRFDGDLGEHQHFRCIKCKRIVDFHHAAFDRIKVPADIGRRFTVLRKSVYLEGICDLCRNSRENS